MSLSSPNLNTTIAGLIALLLFLYFLARKLLGSAAGKTPPVATGGWPLIGHLPALAGAQLPHVALGQMADKDGPICTIHLGTHKALVISSHELAEECFAHHDAVLASRPKFAGAKYLAYDYAMFAFGPHGTYWRDVRKIASSELLSKRRLEALRHLQASEVETSLKELHAFLSEKKDRHGAVVEMKEWFSNLSLNVMVRMIGGKRFAAGDGDADGGAEARRWRRSLREFFRLLGMAVASDAFPFLEWLDVGGHIGAMKGTARELDAMLGEWLEEHRRRRAAGGGSGDVGEGEKDFMDVMIDELHGKERLGDYDVDTVIKSTCLAMVAGGSDTTSVLLMWIVALLLNHPHVLRKVKEELHTHINDSNSIKESDINKLVYLQAVVKETLRLYPSGTLIPRVCIQDRAIAGYRVAKGTRVILNIWKIQRDPRVWPDPLKFKPERFLTTQRNMDLRGKNFEFIPFGSGRRGCPGISFALQLTLLTMASFLHEFEISNPLDGPVDLGASFGLTNMKASPLEVLVKPRVSS